MTDRWRYVCPECGSVLIERNVNSDHPRSTTTHDYHCEACYVPFDEPADRKEAA